MKRLMRRDEKGGKREGASRRQARPPNAVARSAEAEGDSRARDAGKQFRPSAFALRATAPAFPSDTADFVADTPVYTGFLSKPRKKAESLGSIAWGNAPRKRKKGEALKGRNPRFFDFALSGLEVWRTLFVGRCPTLLILGLRPISRFRKMSTFDTPVCGFLKRFSRLLRAVYEVHKTGLAFATGILEIAKSVVAFATGVLAVPKMAVAVSTGGLAFSPSRGPLTKTVLEVPTSVLEIAKMVLETRYGRPSLSFPQYSQYSQNSHSSQYPLGILGILGVLGEYTTLSSPQTT